MIAHLKNVLRELQTVKRAWFTSFNMSPSFVEGYILPQIVGMEEKPRNIRDYEHLQKKLSDEDIDVRFFCDIRMAELNEGKKTAVLFHLINPIHYRLPFSGRPFSLITPVRGCPYQCIFCAAMTYYGKKLRYHSPEKVVEEMKWVKDKFGVEDLLFWSEVFNARRDYVMAVCDEIERKDVRLNWVCSSRVDQLDREMLNRIHRAGCWMISYGIESGSQEILDRSKKGANLEQTREAVCLAKEAGLEVVGHFVFGLPGETKETIRETYKFAEGLGLDYAQFYCAVPFPGTQLYDLARSNGWLNTSDWTGFEQNFSVMDLPGLSSTDVMKLRRKAYKDYYLRPRRIIRVLRRIKSFRELRGLFKKALDFSTWI